ncbi:MAG: DUF4919 domain-containing protein [Deltaproteobacteria bacterium]|nr:DUF4919 domain-containing protein [Deltaproteobacteria bacterium]
MKRIAMRSLLCVICLAAALGVLAGVAAAAEGKKAPKAGVKEKSYDDYVKDLKAGNTEIDYLAFRVSYTKTGFYKPYALTSEIVNLAFDALDNGKYDVALDVASGLLETNYTDMDGHYIAVLAYRGKGDEKLARFHMRIFGGLVDSITSSGDGLTKDTAMIVINVHEEYIWFSVNGFKPQKQQLVNKDGHSFDLMTVTDEKSGEKKDLYFNVDLPFSTLAKELKK